MSSYSQNIGQSPISITVFDCLGPFPAVLNHKITDAETVKTARQQAVHEATQTYLDSHLGPLFNFNAFSEVLAEDLHFVSISQKEEKALTYNDLTRESFLKSMQECHFSNVKEVRNLTLTEQEVLPSTNGINDAFIRELINNSQRVCTVSCEQYRMGNGLMEEGEGWYKIQATLCFICKDSSEKIFKTENFKMVIQTMVQLDYTKTKMTEKAFIPQDALKA